MVKSWPKMYKKNVGKRRKFDKYSKKFKKLIKNHEKSLKTIEH